MAGFVLNTNDDKLLDRSFHIGDPNVREDIMAVSSHPRVVSMQLDGDELEAALWGLENYKKS